MSGSCEYSFDCEIFAPLKKRPATPSSSGEEARYATACAAWSGDRDASPTTSRAGAASSRIRCDFMRPGGTTFAKTLVPSRRRARANVNRRSAIFDAPNAWRGRQLVLLCKSAKSSSVVVGAATVITREGAPARSAGTTRFVSRNGPRKFVANISSNPSAVSIRLRLNTAAVWTRTSSRSCDPPNDFTKARTERRSERSAMRSSTDPAPLACRTVARSARPRPSPRATATTVAPRRPNSLAVAFPSAPVAPVTMQTRPTRLPAAPALCRGGEAAINISFALCEAGHPVPQVASDQGGLLRAGLSEEDPRHRNGQVPRLPYLQWEEEGSTVPRGFYSSRLGYSGSR